MASFRSRLAVLAAALLVALVAVPSASASSSPKLRNGLYRVVAASGTYSTSLDGDGLHTNTSVTFALDRPLTISFGPRSDFSVPVKGSYTKSIASDEMSCSSQGSFTGAQGPELVGQRQGRDGRSLMLGFSGGASPSSGTCVEDLGQLSIPRIAGGIAATRKVAHGSRRGTVTIAVQTNRTTPLDASATETFIASATITLRFLRRER